MTNKYEVRYIGSEDGQEIIFRTTDGAWIPKEPANSDYQAYLRWLNGEEEPSGTL